MRKNKNLEFDVSGIDLVRDFTNALSKEPPWESIVDFASHRSFCGQVLYPKQRTLLKLAYLETEQMTAYDIDTIEKWREGFTNHEEVSGVQPDVWERVKWLKERGYRHFPHIQNIAGRRGSKGVTGGIFGAERIAYFCWLDNWQKFFGVKPHSDGYLSVIATTLDQAKRYQFNDIKLVVEGCEYLRPFISTDKEYYLSFATATDRLYYNELIQRGVPIEREIASIKAMAFSANSASSRGGAGFANFYDEFAHQITGTGSQKTSEQIYNAGQPSLRQFKKHSFTYIPSTPLSQVGMFFTLYNQGVVLMPVYVNGHPELVEVTEKKLKIDAEEELHKATANPMMLICQFPSWELYEDWDRSHLMPLKKTSRVPGPQLSGAVVEYNEELQIIENTNPDAFKVEYRAQFAPVQDAYLKPEKIAAMFEHPEWREPLSHQEKGKLSRRYRIHCDPGLSGANFAMCIGHLEDSPPDADGRVWPHVIIDQLRVWRPMDYADNVVDYVDVQQDLIETLNHFPSTTKITMDQWQSAFFLRDLQNRFAPKIMVDQETFSDASNQQRSEKFKSALNLGWVHSYRDNYYSDNSSCLLELELRFLQFVNGKVKKQEIGPVTTKDLADCVMVVVTDLLHDALDMWSNQHLLASSFGSTNVAGLRSGRELERQVATEHKTMQDRFNEAMNQNRRENVLAANRGGSFQVGSPVRGRYR